MKLQDLVNVADTDIYISCYDVACNNPVQFIPVGNLLRGSAFVMNLTVQEIGVYLDACGLIVMVDIPGELFPALIDYNDGFCVTLEREFEEEV